jgi:mono/diheme cytochrome c family protein
VVKRGLSVKLLLFFLTCLTGVSSPSVERENPYKANESKLPAMKNPYEGDPKAIQEGRKLWFAYGCNGCHGGTGGGGMCPAVINKVWVYGKSDAVLFQLIKLGSVELRNKYGLVRIGKENVVGDMPPFSALSDDDVWKLITYMRSIYKGN